MAGRRGSNGAAGAVWAGDAASGVRGVRTRAGWGVSGAALPALGGSGAASGRQRCSELARVRARVPACSGKGKGGERERGERKREKERVNVLTQGFLKIFHGNSKNFEHESYSKFNFLQLSFQEKIRLSNDLKVKNVNSSLNENPLNPVFFGVFTKFHVVT